MKKMIMFALPALVVLLAQTSNAQAQATTFSGSGSTRIIVKTTDTTQSGSILRWRNYLDTQLWAIGNDYLTNNGHNFWLFDNVTLSTNLYIDNSASATSYLAFGAWAAPGGIEYNEATDQLGLFANGATRVRLTSNALKIGTFPYYQRRASGTPTPSLGANCNGSGSASTPSESSDARGYVTVGQGATTCTVTFAVSWSISSVGYPICAANANKQGLSVAVTASSDTAVSFTLSSAAPDSSTRIYYHCDGVLPPP